MSISASIKRERAKPLTADVPASRSHMETTPNVSIGSTDPTVDAAVSKSHLQTLIERGMVERLTLDVLTRSNQIGDLKKDVRRSDKLTVEYRKQGECWRDDGEYG